MQSSYALTAETLVALGLADDGTPAAHVRWDKTTLSIYMGDSPCLYVLTPVDAYRVLRRLVEMLTGEPLGDDAQVHVADTLGVWSWFWLTGGGTESGDLPGTEHARDWLHSVGLAAVAVAGEGHRLFVFTGDRWEVRDG